MKLPARARRTEITTRAPIIGLAEVKVGYGCVEPLKILSVEGPFQRVQRADTKEPKPDASIPHHGRKTLASARAPARSEIRLILGKLTAPGLDIARPPTAPDMDLTGFVFFTIEQNAKSARTVNFSEHKSPKRTTLCDVHREVTSVRSPRLDSTSTPKSNEAYGIMGDMYIWGRIRRNPRGHDTGSIFPARASDLRVPLNLERPALLGMIF